MNMKTPTPPAAPYLSTRRPLSRRHFLRGTGVVLSFIIGSMLGVVAAWWRRGWVDQWLPSLFAFIGAFAPYFSLYLRSLGFTAAQIGVLSTTQFNMLATNVVAQFSTAQIGGLSTTQITYLPAADFQALSGAQISELSLAQAGYLSTTDLSLLTLGQGVAFAVAQAAQSGSSGGCGATARISSSSRRLVTPTTATSTSGRNGTPGDGKIDPVQGPVAGIVVNKALNLDHGEDFNPLSLK